ncbi:Gastrula zinc finger protein XlCGF57.1 (Fragment) [Anthophora plagiata]
MRVKTTPRQRILLANRIVEPVSEIGDEQSGGEKEVSKDEENVSHRANERTMSNLNANQLENRSVKVKEKDEALNYSEEALDMSIKQKIEASEGNSSICCSNSNCHLHSEEKPKDFIPNDDNNNAVASNGDAENHSSITDTSASEQSTKQRECNDDRLVEAINLCKKNRLEDEEESNRGNDATDENLRNTVLFKIMTDPAFLENIQNQKRSRRYMCQFCKQEFMNNNELTDHMDVKKDESNQVVCCACKKTFAQKRYLRYHQRCHSERTKFTCDICTKKYTRMDNLSRHNTFHVNPDKFSCAYCKKTFARKDLLNKHLKCHDSKYRFFCEACQKYFKDPLMLDNHRKNFHSIV